MYLLFNVVGPLLLLAVILYVTFRTWRRRPGIDAVSEDSARELRADLQEEEIRRDGATRPNP